MITRFGLVRRSPHLTQAQFDAHWRDVHGPLAARLPGLRAYYQHSVQARGDHAILGDWQLDGMSELHFDSASAMTAAFATPSGTDAKEDLGAFLADARMIACESARVIPLQPDSNPGFKRMTLLRRKPGVSDREFRHEWQVVHAEMVRQWPGVLGYHQHLVIDRFHASPIESASHDEVPVDGLVEIWFADAAQADRALDIPIVQDTMAHARDFLSEITPFVVTSRRIL